MNYLEFSGLGMNLFDVVDITIPAWFILALGVLVLTAMIWYYVKRQRVRSAAVKYSDVRIVSRAARSHRRRYRIILPILRMAAIALFFVAFARPRSGTEVKEITSKGVDIMLALDISSSMQAEDFKPNNRLFVAKEEIKKFISKRSNDRIGLVVFSRHSFTQCPLTVDYGVVLRFVDQVDFGVIEDGTAIGMGIANSVNRLRESDAKSKVIILLTDGENNAGEIDPVTAAGLAAAFDIKIYTIGAGRPGNAMFPVDDPLFGKRYVYQPTRIDEATLQEIAKVTCGRYFRARSEKELAEIYTLIDQMEKTEIQVSASIQYRELFHYFTIAGLILLALEVVLANSVFRKLP
jgi:Ca-activated chloride channel family protein